MNKNYTFLPHELEHLLYLKEHAYECSLFLKRDNEAFPIKKPCSVYLVGNGVRYTVIGGTGSGAVNVKYKENVENAFLNAGFKVDSEEWLNQYDLVRKQNEIDHINEVKKEAKSRHVMAASFAIGKEIRESEYDISLSFDSDIAIYVLSRNAGEGSDRTLRKGDVLLTDTEIKSILELNKKYKKFMLVLNVPGYVDISPVLEVKNILYLSQLGSLTGDILVDIVLGKKNPCGKLSTTWAYLNDYPYINTAIDEDECRYTEGIYVGYRYFSSKGIKPMFPFGFGKSYSSFEYELSGYYFVNDTISLKFNVRNVSKYVGKETLQLYLKGGKGRPNIELVSFNKTQLVKPKEKEELELKFSLRDFPVYDLAKEAYMLYKGNYVVSIGNSSDNLIDVISIALKDDVVIKKCKNLFSKQDFDDLDLSKEITEVDEKLLHINLDKKAFGSTDTVEYVDTYNVKVPEQVKKMSVTELALLSCGDYKGGIDGMIGQSCSLVSGGAGETSLRVKDVPALNMVDGPAGLRVTQEFILNSKGAFPTVSDSIYEIISKYIPSPIAKLISPERNLKKKGSRVLQVATALPIATALAQSFNPGFIYGCGKLVKEEMSLFGVDIWLAPALNIHRSILCGRNFEYYSEDPFVSSVCTSNIVNSVQEDKHKVVTIKHYACNNQETNRTNNNSMVSEKALRELYLRGFEKTIKWSNPRSIMTSYNLVDGIHSSESHALVTDILRSEWSYKGLIMTDWIKTNQDYKKGNKYPNSFASRNIKNGTNINMPGAKVDIKDIKKAIKKGYLSLDELRNNAAIVYNFVNAIKND